MGGKGSIQTKIFEVSSTLVKSKVKQQKRARGWRAESLPAVPTGERWGPGSRCLAAGEDVPSLGLSEGEAGPTPASTAALCESSACPGKKICKHTVTYGHSIPSDHTVAHNHL